MSEETKFLLDAQNILKESFNLKDFRSLQSATLKELAKKKDTLLMMPTGMGKSLCFQIPARIWNQQNQSVCVVISPLIALMKDQVDSILQKGYRATYINSSLSREERESRYRALSQGLYEIIYVTPERFRKKEFCDALNKNEISLLAVDEAHCISSWGHDFRLDYSRLGEIREQLGNPLCLAVTATATKDVQSDIIRELSLNNPSVLDAGIDRPNLSLQVIDVHGIDQKVQAFMAFQHQFASQAVSIGTGARIVYFSLIDTLEKFSHLLRKVNVPHLKYHGQLQAQERSRIQNQFLSSKDALILATPAFGLGVNKENVRSVFHAEIPQSIEAYFQEVGRAGRDGLAANCLMLFDPDDLSIQMDFLKWSHPDPGFIQALLNLIQRNSMRLKAEGLDYLRTQMNFYNRRDFRVETALSLLERWECISSTQTKEMDYLAEIPKEFLDQNQFESYYKHALSKLHALYEYAQNTETCRSRLIKKYFAYTDLNDCGVCDICQKKS